VDVNLASGAFSLLADTQWVRGWASVAPQGMPGFCPTSWRTLAR
jgi:hypothetical protein